MNYYCFVRDNEGTGLSFSVSKTGQASILNPDRLYPISIADALEIQVQLTALGYASYVCDEGGKIIREIYFNDGELVRVA